ncbi:glycoside hydrolase family 13 protein [Demequina gelatinilytica]|uniref:glycoside hydrolase family 13 protein n=1 Tax=Demequina gelatinilytica TaxID=1638980 RepID=UPI0007864E1D|nr:glycoside hydrolase family 13 protein [Demequina gelatinilytica]
MAHTVAAQDIATADAAAHDWWRSSVIYQIYPRSFADSSGTGVGDLRGITARLESLADLGVDAIWLSPFYRSPQKDAGYDVSDFRDVDPLFGTLDDFDAMVARAHELGLRVIADIVPNHSSDQHPWFQAALAAGPGSKERERYIFRDGKGEHGELPPNNWESVFGGPMWTRVTEPDGTPGQWYLHIFDTSQPDFDWELEEVREEFDGVLRFWLDRGVDGFRVDVAHGLIKADGLPDFVQDDEEASMGGGAATQSPYWAQDRVHEIWRRWRKVTDEYEGQRILAAEAWVYPLEFMANWVRPDEMHQTFNFGYMETHWDAADLRAVIDDSITTFGAVGAPSTWVLSNHDMIRHATRLALGKDTPQGHGVGPASPGLPDVEEGIRRARAASLFMLSLPGGAYLYQGEELGLPEAIDIPDEARQDPTWHRTEGERYGRDGCRVPLPWEADAPAYGFSPTGDAWLPQPAVYGTLARDAQSGVEGSTLEMYRAALRLRREHRIGVGSGDVAWEDSPEGVLIHRVGDIRVIANVSGAPVPVEGDVLVTSHALEDGALPADATVWVRVRG